MRLAVGDGWSMVSSAPARAVKGKPELLGGHLPGWRSRRISQEHRLVYRVAGAGKEQVLQVAQCRYHY
jgi:Txe/YoeB family toxin of toxin-antitoxin system